MTNRLIVIVAHNQSTTLKVAVFDNEKDAGKQFSKLMKTKDWYAQMEGVDLNKLINLKERVK